jgi:P-type E1-E2 ATPase
VQELRAGQAIEALGRMVPINATIRRGGDSLEVPADRIVPGDIVLLEAGDRVPADLRLLEVDNLQIDEAALTGESLPVAKDDAPVASDAPIGDRRCMAFGGTLVTAGTATSVAVATGEPDRARPHFRTAGRDDRA